MIILDGGLGQELVKRAGKATDLWSMQALLDNPDMVRAVHDDYFAAGAQIATTNTYSVLPDRLESKGLADKLRPMTVLACEMAVASRDCSWIWAGCRVIGSDWLFLSTRQGPTSRAGRRNLCRYCAAPCGLCGFSHSGNYGLCRSSAWGVDGCGGDGQTDLCLPLCG